MTNREFSDIPIDEDTTIQSSKPIKFGGLDAIVQTWSWDGFRGQSVIIHDRDANGLSDSMIQQMLVDEGLVQDASIVRRRGGYTFINLSPPT